MRVKAVGRMLYGMEDVYWGSGSSRRHYRHPMGLYAVGNTYRLPPPAYCPACTHYIHLICVGFVGNLRYAEILDFVLGFTTMDIACDDGRAMGRWAFQ